MPRKKNQAQLKREIIKYISQGCTKAASYGAADISKRTFYDWVKADETFQKNIVAAVAKARQKVEKKLVDSILSGDRLLLMYWLQNRFPEDWQDTRQIKVDQHTVVEDKRIDGMSDIEIIKELEKSGIDCTTFKQKIKEQEEAS